jgi:adenylate cyclase
MEPKVYDRKMSAILSADVKGYSRLMRSDEPATVHTLTQYRAIIAERIANYQGRVVDSPGDNVLAEFGSVVHAVQCGFDIQQSLQSKNAMLPEERRMAFRIGINLGDVLQDGERIYGDGVNVAARIQSLAEAGGICVSGSAYDQIENKFAFGCEFLGKRTVKNISTPIRVYRLSNDDAGRGCAVGAGIKKLSNRLIVATLFGLLIISVAGFLGWKGYRRAASGQFESASVDNMAYPLPDKPSIAVLPFMNLSGSENDSLIAKALTEDVINALSRVPELFVIANASSSTYEGKTRKIGQVSEELGVRYILDGSVQRSKDRLRFTVQLADALAGHQIWADRFDRTPEDLFVL